MKKNETKEKEKRGSAITEKEIAEMTTWECLRKCIGWKAALFPILKPRKSDFMALAHIVLFALQIIPWGIIFSFFYARDIVKMAKINVSRVNRKEQESKEEVLKMIDNSAPKTSKAPASKKNTTKKTKKTDGQKGTKTKD